MCLRAGFKEAACVEAKAQSEIDVLRVEVSKALDENSA